MHKPMADFPVSFANLLRARFPYIYVGTWEEERVLGLIREGEIVDETGFVGKGVAVRVLENQERISPPG